MRQVPPSLVLVALLAAGCGEPVVRSADLDGSIAEVRDSLEPRQRADFDEAIALLRLAGSGKVPGTERVALDGMTAAEVLAEAGRVELRRERAVEQERAAAAREVLDAEERLSRLRVLRFAPEWIGETRVEADLGVRSDLDFPVGSAWLRVEVTMPGGPSRSGEELVTFQPALAPGEERSVRLLISGDEAASLPVESPAVLTHRFVMVEHGGQVRLQVPTPEARAAAEHELADAERRIAELEAKLAAAAANVGSN
ncbi:MAG: hypothetical protein AMXMBFR36_07870 [Acidobacteriota bacterium]